MQALIISDCYDHGMIRLSEEPRCLWKVSNIPIL